MTLFMSVMGLGGVRNDLHSCLTFKGMFFFPAVKLL